MFLVHSIIVSFLRTQPFQARAIHTAFMREHNRIVGELAQINPHWNDEQLFQNARRTMSAMMQHVTYTTVSATRC